MGKRRARSRRSRRSLPDDLIPDILHRLPPDDPAGIVRSSAVCKAWRRIITDPAFAGRYRALHPAAPVLGFLHRPIDNRKDPRFVSTTSFRAAAADHRHHPLDCRHGRAVFFDYGSPSDHGSYVVWDPTTGERHKLPPDGLGDEYLPHAAVVCAADGACDHRGCSGGPFVVAFVGVEILEEMDALLAMGTDEGDDEEDDEDEDDDRDHYLDAHACFYDSATGEMTGRIDIHLEYGRYHLDDDRPAVLVGDSLYFLCSPGILRYRYGLLRRLGGTFYWGMKSAAGTVIREGDILSMMKLPTGKRFGFGKNADAALMEAEGGGLGLACLTGTKLYLSAMESEGTAGDDDRWVQRRVIDLKTLLLPLGNNPKRKPCFSGVAQGASVIFVRTEDGVFSVDHGGSSLQARKVCEMGMVDSWVYPFVSFYTESLLRKLASGKLPARVGNQ